MVRFLWAVAAFADETGATVDCVDEDQECVTSGGLPGLCNADLECVTDDCYEDGEECVVDGDWGTCDGEVCVTGCGCATAPGGQWGILVPVAFVGLGLRRRRIGASPGTARRARAAERSGSDR